MQQRPSFCLMQAAILISISGCEVKSKADFKSVAAQAPVESLISPVNPEGRTIQSRYGVPKGFKRTVAVQGSFSEYLRKLPLKPDKSPVLLYNGKKKNSQDVHAAVIDKEIGNQNLLQCADAVIKLRSEYLYQQGNPGSIHFNFTSGDRADFSKFAQGYRAIIKGNSVSWQKTASPSSDYNTLRQYQDLVFTYAGTASLEKELKAVTNFDDIQPGDVLIQGGHPGHAVLVVDMAQHEHSGEKLVMLAQSYMPAQDIHLLINPHTKCSRPGTALRTPANLLRPNGTSVPAISGDSKNS